MRFGLRLGGCVSALLGLVLQTRHSRSHHTAHPQTQVSPGAHLWVPYETEQCQAACGVARMWATLFWSMQFANALACVYLHYNRERGLALLSVAQRATVGAVLLKAYAGGVIYLPIGLAGGCCEWAFALAFARELRRR